MEEDSKIVKAAGWLLVLLVVSILVYCWVVFVALVCVPLFGVYPWGWPVTYLVWFHVLLFFVFWSYFRAVFTTSFVPSYFKHEIDTEVEYTEEPNTNEQSILSTKKRHCEKCDQDKPDRAHHCSRCGRCVLKMDHHCPWINNCVGWNNYKYFILFTTYTLLLCISGIVMIIPVMIFTWEWSNLTWDDILVLGALLLGAVFAITLIGFVVMHWRFALGNLTTIEAMEKNFSWGSSPYDIGMYSNWVSVFGRNPIFWCLPVNTLVHDGCNFPKSGL